MAMGILSAVTAITLLGIGIGGALGNVGCYGYQSSQYPMYDYYCNDVNRVRHCSFVLKF